RHTDHARHVATRLAADRGWHRYRLSRHDRLARSRQPRHGPREQPRDLERGRQSGALIELAARDRERVSRLALRYRGAVTAARFGSVLMLSLLALPARAQDDAGVPDASEAPPVAPEVEPAPETGAQESLTDGGAPEEPTSPEPEPTPEPPA